MRAVPPRSRSDDRASSAKYDRELYREPDKGNGSYYSDSVFVTEGGGIGINCGGCVMVKPIREWFRLGTLEANPIFIMDENGSIRLARGLGENAKPNLQEKLAGSKEG